ncbi:uncharacterized protein MELLADRAFT_104293 [Melampsora larici-populina 98AG31]|uniref:Uncharacterized protein n=1 Tax=Melampsora larici-populina (strain 98AG31 / pathotype 3-4-7) TaxID=747676 RepID=F4RE85_MELLP|nr:uncharacterized protein MELLADRAFT_104293 [Melampsora larici-populina 98AG31]EGG09050.1 hypothetical protein MELLADRAFT_104293 [Melampsora larici-populina 98AG31]
MTSPTDASGRTPLDPSHQSSFAAETTKLHSTLPPQSQFSHSHIPHDQSGNPIAPLIQTLHSDLYVFLEPGHESKLSKITKLLIYRVLLHFNKASKSRLTQNKGVLYDTFKKDLLPHLIPFQLPSPPTAPTLGSEIPDFNPLGRKTTRKMLREAILRSAPDTEIPSGARTDGLQLLYQAHVDKDLVIPGQTDKIRPPRVVRSHEVESQDMEELRFALQVHAPTVFVHSIPMSHTVLVNLYRMFILEENIPYGKLVLAAHVSLYTGYFKCSSCGVFKLHSGIEVSRETRDAHALLDRRNLAQSQLNTPTHVSSRNTSSLNQRQAVAHDEELSTRVAQLNIANSPPPISTFEHPLVSQYPRSGSRSQGAIPAQPPTSTRQPSSHEYRAGDTGVVDPCHNSSPGSPHHNRSIATEKTCSAAIAMRNSGVQEYDCGQYSAV